MGKRSAPGVDHPAMLDPRVRAGDVETLAQRGRLALEITAHEVFTDRVPSRGVTPQPGQAEMHAVLSAAQQAGEQGQYR